MSTHAKLSASGSHRWLYCPGSVHAEEGRKESASPHAVEGTIAHSLAETVLDRGGSAFDWEGHQHPEHPGHDIPHEMCSAVQEYVDYVKSLGGLQMYEERVDFSPWVPEGFGTADCIAIVGTTLHVVDLKYGKGVQVDAEGNSQGVLYALGALNEYDTFYDIERVHVVIHQPRLDHVSEWALDVNELRYWGEWIKERAERACDPNAERVPGESQCRWCKAKADCPALERYTQETIGAQFDNLDTLGSPDRLPLERLAEVLHAKKLIVSWLDAVEAHVRERLDSGETVPGWKLVAGRSVRQWGDEAEAEVKLSELLGESAHERKLLTPAKAEKALGKKRAAEIKGLIVKPEGKPTLAPESDNRPPIGATVDDFD